MEKYHPFFFFFFFFWLLLLLHVSHCDTLLSFACSCQSTSHLGFSGYAKDQRMNLITIPCLIYASMQHLFQMRNSSHQTLSMIPVVYCLLEATPPSLFPLTKISVTKSLVTYLHVILLYPDPCLTNPCRSGGLCRRTGAGYECDCPQDFIGTNCETYAPRGKILSIYFFQKCDLQFLSFINYSSSHNDVYHLEATT